MRGCQFATLRVFALSMIAVSSCASACGDEASRQTTRPKHSAALKALEISRLAAENGLTELSLRAFRNALSAGRPVTESTAIVNANTVSPDGNVIAKVSGTITYSPEYFTTQIASQQSELDRIWREKNFPATQVYNSMIDAVLPPGDHHAVNLYLGWVDTSLTRMPDVTGIGLRLVQWAERAECLPDLLERIETRDTRAGERLDLLHLKAEIAVRSDDDQLLRSVVAQLSNQTGPEASLADCLRALAIALKAVRQGNVKNHVVLPILSDTLDVAIRTARTDQGKAMHGPVMDLLLVAAEAHFRVGDTERGERLVEQYLKEGTQNAQPDTLRFGQKRKGNLYQAAAMFFDADLPQQAFDKLAEAAKIEGESESALSSRLLADIFRHVKAMDPQERYQQLLRITFGPPDTDGRLSLISGQSLVGEKAPGVKSTGVMLIEAAAAADRLEQLEQKLERMVKDDVRKAATLLAIICIRTDAIERAAVLIEQQAESVGYDFRTRQKTRNLWTDLVLLAEASKQSELSDSVTKLANELLPYADRADRPDVTSATRRFAFAASETQPPVAPSLWIPSSGLPVTGSNSSITRPTWQHSAGIASRICGAGWDSLYLPFPLTGSFDFVVELPAVQRREAGVGYGGVFFEPGLRNQSVMFRTVGGDQQRPGPLSLVREFEINDVRIRVRDGNAEVVLNGAPLESSDVIAGSSPWISLTARPGQLASWRFPRIEGDPIIPDSVKLSSDPEMRTWTTRCFGNNRQRVSLLRSSQKDTDAAPDTPAQHNWTWKDDVIIGAAISTGSVADTVRADVLNVAAPNLLQYDRPLQPGDAVTWEFEYKDELCFGVSLGSRAIQLENQNLVRLNLVDQSRAPGNEFDLTTLNEGWNSASLRLTDTATVFEINGEEIDSWPLPGIYDRQFGFYHDSHRSRIHVRNVQLTGNWPRKVPDALRSGIVAPASSMSNIGIPEDLWTAGPLSVVDRLRELPAEERLSLLTGWLIPSADGQPLRVGADIRASSEAKTTPPIVDSPAVLLFETARNVGALDALPRQVEEHHHVSEEDGVVQDLLLALFAILREQNEQASDQLEKILESRAFADAVENGVATTKTESALSSVITLIASHAGDDPKLRAYSGRLLKRLTNIDGHLQRYRKYLQTQLQSADQPAASLRGGWQTASYPVRSRGHFQSDKACWEQTGAESIRHVPGGDGALFLNVPLRGTFTVTCELRNDDHRALQVGYNARSINFGGSNERVIHSELFGRMGRRHYLSEPLTERREVSLKIEVDQQHCTFFAGDRQVFTDSVQQEFDPWLFVLCPAHATGEIRSVRVTGDYQIPREIRLDCSTWFQGWSAAHFNETLGAGSPWRSTDNVIHARRKQTGQKYIESLLQYRRPMFEDGTIRYEFLYEQNQILLHPAIGRSAFLLDPNRGVVLHQLTDDRYHTEPVIADNESFAREDQLSDSIPLKNAAWNTMEVVLVEDVMTLRLNEVPVYRHRMTESDSRLFGLFHFKDQTSGQVRNITWRGDWPRELPQQLREGTE